MGNKIPQSLIAFPREVSIRWSRNCQDIKFRELIMTMPEKTSHLENIFYDSINFSPIHVFSDEAKNSLKIENAGGRSEISEAYSIEYFVRVFGARNILYETEVEYWLEYSMVDFVCSIPTMNGETKIGISVTRAMGYPGPDFFTYEQGLHLLRKKLFGLIVARNSVTKKHSFDRSILHIWCQTPRIAKLLKKAYTSFDIYDYGLDICGIVSLSLTICPDECIYQNKYPLELCK